MKLVDVHSRLVSDVDVGAAVAREKSEAMRRAVNSTMLTEKHFLA